MEHIYYPRVIVDLGKLTHNIRIVREACAKNHVEIASVVKGVWAIPEVARAALDAGVTELASSRISQVRRLREAGIQAKMLMIRVPAMGEVEDAVRFADGSLNSEISVVKALDEEAGRQNKIHEIILMRDVGDLREGFWDSRELLEAALFVEKECSNLYLRGIGLNVGCYGSLLPTREKLQELVEDGQRIEQAIGRKLETLSGGATSSLLRIIDGDMPEGINHLRIGEGALLGRDIPQFYGKELPGLLEETFCLEAELIEVKEKPSHPVGELGVDAFGRKREYQDRGIRLRGLAAMGRADYGDPVDLYPMEAGVEILGASSDHTILDLEEAEKDWKVGDVMHFGLSYASMLFLTNSPDVEIVLKK